MNLHLFHKKCDHSSRPFYTMPDPVNPKYSNSYDMFVREEEIIRELSEYMMRICLPNGSRRTVCQSKAV